LDSLEQGKHLEGIERSNSIMEFEKIAQYNILRILKRSMIDQWSRGPRKIVDYWRRKV
jgi:hypothetical protein